MTTPLSKVHKDQSKEKLDIKSNSKSKRGVIKLDSFDPHYKTNFNYRTGFHLYPDLIFQTFNQTGTLQVMRLKDKKIKVFENPNPISTFYAYSPYILTVHTTKQNNQTIQILDTTAWSVETFDIDIESPIRLAFWSSRGILLVTSEFYKFQQRISSTDEKRIVNLHLKHNVEKPTWHLSRIKKSIVLLASPESYEVIDVSVGKQLVYETRSSNIESFILSNLSDNYMVICTSETIHIHNLSMRSDNSSKVNITKLESPPSALEVSDNQLIVGFFSGAINVYNINTGALIREINPPVKVSGANTTIYEQLGTRITNLKVDRNILFSSSITGAVLVWNLDMDNNVLTSLSSVKPIKELLPSLSSSSSSSSEGETHTVLTMSYSVNTLDVLLKSQDQYYVATWSVSRYFKSNNFKGFLSGILQLKPELKPTSKSKPYYFELYGHVLYQFTNDKSKSAISSYYFGETSSVRLRRTGKRNYIELTVNSNTKLFLHTEKSEERSWLKYFTAATEGIKNKSLWEISIDEIKWEKTESGDRVVLADKTWKAVCKNKEVAIRSLTSLSTSNEKNLNLDKYLAVKHASINSIIGYTTGPQKLIMYQYSPFFSITLSDLIHGQTLNIKPIIPKTNEVAVCTPILSSVEYTWKYFSIISLELAEAMKYLHNFILNKVLTPIILKNLNPNNIRISTLSSDVTPLIKITDFDFESNPDESVSDDRLPYTAPESILSRSYTQSSDVYSYGVILWEMVSLQKPYAKMTREQIMESLEKNRTLQIPSYVPVDIKSIIERCLDPSPSRRPSFKDITLDDKIYRAAVECLQDGRILKSVSSIKNGQLSPRKQEETEDDIVLYGRSSELKGLLVGLRGAHSGQQPQVVFLKGPSGIGKGTITERFSKISSTMTFIGTCNSFSKQPFQVLRSAFSSRPFMNTPNPEETMKYVKSQLTYSFDSTSISVLQQVFPTISFLFGRPKKVLTEGIEPERVHKIIYKMMQLMTNRSSGAPLVLILNQLQWADEQSVQFLKYLSKQEIGSILLVLSYEHNLTISSQESQQMRELQECFKKSAWNHQSFNLKPLLEEDVKLMASSYLGISIDHPKLPNLSKSIFEQSGGIPFAVTQILGQQDLDEIKKSLNHGQEIEICMDKLDCPIEIAKSGMKGLSSRAKSILFLASFISESFTASMIGKLEKRIKITYDDKNGPSATIIEEAKKFHQRKSSSSISDISSVTPKKRDLDDRSTRLMEFAELSSSSSEKLLVSNSSDQLPIQLDKSASTTSASMSHASSQHSKKSILSYLEKATKKNIIKVESDDGEESKYRFTSVTMYESLNSVFPPTISEDIHYTIAQVYLSLLKGKKKFQNISIVEVADHFNMSSVKQKPELERIIVANSNLEAAKYIHQMTGVHNLGFKYINSAVNALGLVKSPTEPMWKVDHDLVWKIYLELFICEQQTANFAQAKKTLHAMEPHAKVNIEKLNIAYLRLLLCVGEAKIEDYFALIVETSPLLKVRVSPTSVDEFQSANELIKKKIEGSLKKTIPEYIVGRKVIKRDDQADSDEIQAIVKFMVLATTFALNLGGKAIYYLSLQMISFYIDHPELKMHPSCVLGLCISYARMKEYRSRNLLLDYLNTYFKKVSNLGEDFWHGAKVFCGVHAMNQLYSTLPAETLLEEFVPLIADNIKETMWTTTAFQFFMNFVDVFSGAHVDAVLKSSTSFHKESPFYSLMESFFLVFQSLKSGTPLDVIIKAALKVPPVAEYLAEASTSIILYEFYWNTGTLMDRVESYFKLSGINIGDWFEGSVQETATFICITAIYFKTAIKSSKEKRELYYKNGMILLNLLKSWDNGGGNLSSSILMLEALSEYIGLLNNKKNSSLHDQMAVFSKFCEAIEISSSKKNLFHLSIGLESATEFCFRYNLTPFNTMFLQQTIHSYIEYGAIAKARSVQESYSSKMSNFSSLGNIKSDSEFPSIMSDEFSSKVLQMYTDAINREYHHVPKSIRSTDLSKFGILLDNFLRITNSVADSKLQLTNTEDENTNEISSSESESATLLPTVKLDLIKITDLLEELQTQFQSLFNTKYKTSLNILEGQSCPSKFLSSKYQLLIMINSLLMAHIDKLSNNQNMYLSISSRSSSNHSSILNTRHH
eukprot:TRINITY_DN4760_c0_g1_i1.p1 TRINITY_DN4760_c0_g1~~TRINITY_DN4760_c0_g1_i1.p1  ORF type:complete len:2124 (-),score=355.67 TRINITY_DN4760_c0_g1_i1:709-7080(-)